MGINPRGVGFDGEKIGGTNLGGKALRNLGARKGVLQGTFTAGTSPWGIAFDGANIWVANQSSNNVTQLRASDGVLPVSYTKLTLPKSE